MKHVLILLFSSMIFGCSPRIDFVSYQDAFKEWNFKKKINEVDSSASMTIEINLYKGLFEGRESFLSFKRNYYNIDFKKIDALYTEKDIKSFWKHGYDTKDTSFIPKYCKVKVTHLNRDKIILEFEIKDNAISDKLKGKCKLKFSNSVPDVEGVFRYYKN